MTTAPNQKSPFPNMAFPVMSIAAIATLILTVIALPLGILGLAGMLYLLFVCRPLLPVCAPDAKGDSIVVSPAEGVICSITRSEKGLHIRLRQQWDSRLRIAMPVSGRIEQNLYIDGAYLSETDTAWEAVNARRELMIEMADGRLLELLQWANPLCRWQISPALEGQMLAQGDACALNLLAGAVEIILPADYESDIALGAYCVAGQTVIAKSSVQKKARA